MPVGRWPSDDDPDRHVLDAELPHVPVRQWVLSLSFPLRYRLAYNQPLCTAVHRVLAGALRARVRRLGRARGHPDAQTGSVTFVQRYGGGLNLNLHMHMLGLDGWFYRSEAVRSLSSPRPLRPSRTWRRSCSTCRRE